MKFMDNVQFAFTVDDVCLKDFSSVYGFRQLLDFLNEEDVPATFFVVPFDSDIPLDKKPEWVDILQEALSTGHELALHGYRHQAFEWGIPPEFIMAYEHEESRRLTENRKEIESHFTVEKFSAKLNLGLDIFQQALSLRPKGFRAPYASTCPALLPAVKSCGFDYDSTLIINPKGWKYVVKDYTPGIIWRKDVPHGPFRHTAGLVEIPIMAEYTWFLKAADIERHFGLIKEDFDLSAETGGTMVPVCHVGPVTGPNDAGLEVYRRLFRHARKKGVIFQTLSKIAANLGLDRRCSAGS